MEAETGRMQPEARDAQVCRRYQELEEAGGTPPPEPLEGAQPRAHRTPDF